MIFFLYYRILRALRHRPISENGLRDLRNISLRQHRQVIKMLISIVIAFFFCWTPLCIYFALKMFQPNLFLEDKCHIIVVLFFYVFPSHSTAFNPRNLFCLAQIIDRRCRIYVVNYFLSGIEGFLSRTLMH